MLPVNNNVKINNKATSQTIPEKNVSKKTSKDQPETDSLAATIELSTSATVKEEEEKGVFSASVFQKEEKKSNADMYKIQKTENNTDDTLLSSKKSMFDMLKKQARLYMPHSYTGDSWKTFARLMTEAIKASSGVTGKNTNADIAALDKAIQLLQKGIASLKILIGKDEKITRDFLPEDKDDQKSDGAAQAQALVDAHSAAAAAEVAPAAPVAPAAVPTGATVDIDV